MGQSWQAMAAAFVVHGMLAVSQIYWTTTLQRLVPRQLLGRVVSVNWLVATALAPLSFALAGMLSRVLSARSIIFVGSLIGACTLIVLLRAPNVRDPEKQVVAQPGREPKFHTARVEASSPAPQPPS
jgi:hypothetical protein